MASRQVDLDNERLEGAMEMAGSLYDELSQPMQTIYGYSDLLLMSISDKDQVYEKIMGIKQQVDRMVSVIDKLRDFKGCEKNSYGKSSENCIYKQTENSVRIS